MQFSPSCRLKLPITSIGLKHFKFCFVSSADAGFLTLRLRLFWLVGAITPLPNEDQVACQFPKPILLNTVRTRAGAFRGRRTLRAYYLLVQGICARPVRLVSQHCGHPDVPCWQPRYIGHPGRDDDNGRQTDTVCPKTALRFAAELSETFSYWSFFLRKSGARLIRFFICTETQ